jgi:hypothetical protein
MGQFRENETRCAEKRVPGSELLDFVVSFAPGGHGKFPYSGR